MKKTFPNRHAVFHAFDHRVGTSLSLSLPRVIYVSIFINFTLFPFWPNESEFDAMPRRRTSHSMSIFTLWSRFDYNLIVVFVASPRFGSTYLMRSISELNCSRCCRRKNLEIVGRMRFSRRRGHWIRFEGHRKIWKMNFGCGLLWLLKWNETEDGRFSQCILGHFMARNSTRNADAEKERVECRESHMSIVYHIGPKHFYCGFFFKFFYLGISQLCVWLAPWTAFQLIVAE